MLSQTDTQTVPPARSVDYFQAARSVDYFQETQRSVESDDSMCTGFAWAPAHLQTQQQGEQPDGRQQGAIVPCRPARVLHREVDASDNGPTKSPDALPPLSDLVKETTHVSLLFSGRGAIGRWNSKSQCGGISTKKKIAHKFTRCTVLGIAESLERRLVAGVLSSKSNTEVFASPACTRLICLPGGRGLPSLDISDYTEIRFKAEHSRVEIVQKDGTSLWLYKVGKTEHSFMRDCLSACRSYAQQKNETLEKLASSPANSTSRKDVPTAETEQNGARPHRALESAGSPSKSTPVIPKLHLGGVGNYPLPDSINVPQPTDSNCPKKTMLSTQKLARQQINVLQVAHSTPQAPVSVSSAVRDAESLLASVTAFKSVPKGIHMPQSFQSHNITATTGHVYVAAAGATTASGGNPITRIALPFHLDITSKDGSSAQNWMLAGANIGPLVQPNYAAHLRTPGHFHQPAGHLASEPPAQPRITSVHMKSEGAQEWSPAPHRVPRLVSVTPHKTPDSDPAVMQRALDNVRHSPNLLPHVFFSPPPFTLVESQSQFRRGARQRSAVARPLIGPLA